MEWIHLFVLFGRKENALIKKRTWRIGTFIREI